ncbi:hypothetical protein PM082_013872 [Marasmius tenuissimus]|nr:hypothetical protein PM082_013872 [Marasmius tenuissimus]
MHYIHENLEEAQGQGEIQTNDYVGNGLVPGVPCGVRTSQTEHELGNHFRGTTESVDDERLNFRPIEPTSVNDEGNMGESTLDQRGVETVATSSNRRPQPFPILVSCQSSPTIPSPTEDASPLHRGSIRFLPRVRITSGLSGSRRHRSSTTESVSPATPNLISVPPMNLVGQSSPASLASTRSSSMSSSISAPLRFREQESLPSKWGPLGRRVNLFASGGKRSRRSLNDVKSVWDGYGYFGSTGAGDPNHIQNGDEDESSPLLRRREDDAADINREIDAVFGKWPRRLLNRHWWWWQIEPVVCCWWCANDVYLMDE